MIATDPRNGEVLAMVSKPSFDPRIFSALALKLNGAEREQEYRELKLHPETPLINRSIQGIYPTGSTWKILIAAAGLQEGAIMEEDSRIICGGGIQVGNRFAHCMSNHGRPDIRTAIKVSCDGYFYCLALQLGVDKINYYIKSYGRGQRTGIDLPHEVRGIIPSREWKARVNSRDPQWKDFDTVLAGIGLGGEFYTPQLIKEVVGEQLANISCFQPKSGPSPIFPRRISPLFAMVCGAPLMVRAARRGAPRLRTLISPAKPARRK